MSAGILLLAVGIILPFLGIKVHDVLHYGMLTAVLLMESYVLVQMRREEKERRTTMDALQSFRAALGREVYLEQICALISDAVNEVRFTSASMAAYSKMALFCS